MISFTDSGGKTPEYASSNTAIISGGVILAVMVGCGWNRENPATGYDKLILTCFHFIQEEIL
jgi:hypothetical protein